MHPDYIMPGTKCSFICQIDWTLIKKLSLKKILITQRFCCEPK